MSIPTAAFLDTSIFDGQNYNFQSTALSTFAPACSKRSVKLLLPDPTEREIRRHIEERATEALGLVDRAHRKAPFLSKLKGFGREFRSPALELLEAKSLGGQQWAAFLQQFSVVRLGYKALDVDKVMGWYDTMQAPFGQGQKRKEFPDAFAIQMLDAHARNEKVSVAVVSADQDFKVACERYSGLLYFQALPKLTELLLSDDTRVERVRLAIQDKVSLIEEAILEVLPGVDFDHRTEALEVHGYDDVESEGVDVSIIAIGDDECTVAFDTVLGMKFDMRWEETTDDGMTYMNQRDVRERVELSGTAKVLFTEGGKEVSEVRLVALDQNIVHLHEGPFSWW